jgi:tripartite-type tricarboxylate transporter receptor subunit TctC
MMQTRKTVVVFLALAGVLALKANAATEVYPSQPITIIVPYTAGGPSDALLRIVGERIQRSLGRPVVIDNVGGAAGRIGTGRGARATPDGYTLINGGSGTHVTNGAVYPLTYNVVSDFEPIALLANTPQLIVAKRATPANDLRELIAWLKANPDKASQGTSGIGSNSHVAGAFFQKLTGTRFQFVPYRGTAMTDLVSGHVDLMIDQASNALTQIRSGTIKAYAVAAKNRMVVAPEIPTVDEVGLPGFHVHNWYALFAPKGTPKPIISTLNHAVVEALAEAPVRTRLAGLGYELFPREEQTPEALHAFQKADIEKWWPIIREAGIKAE